MVREADNIEIKQNKERWSCGSEAEGSAERMVHRLLIAYTQSRARCARAFSVFVARDTHQNSFVQALLCLVCSASTMSARPRKRPKLTTATHHNSIKSTGGFYHDRIPLEDDFEVFNVCTVSSGPNHIPIETSKSFLPSTWTYGSSWAPDDDLEYALDPDDEWYDEVLEADVMDEVIMPKTKKKRSEASVCTLLVVTRTFLKILKARPHVYWLNNSRDLYLDEILRHEGRGDFISDAHCPDCLSRGSKTPEKPEFRCRDCFLPDLTCRTCFIRRHRLNPFHAVEVSMPSCLSTQCCDIFCEALGWEVVLQDHAEGNRPCHSSEPHQHEVPNTSSL